MTKPKIIQATTPQIRESTASADNGTNAPKYLANWG